MEFSQYRGPESAELELVWSSLSDDQQNRIQAVADKQWPLFVMAVAMGQMDYAESKMQAVVRESHEIAGIFVA